MTRGCPAVCPLFLPLIFLSAFQDSLQSCCVAGESPPSRRTALACLRLPGNSRRGVQSDKKFMFSSNRAKENGGPTPKRMKTRQNKDSVREMEEGVGLQSQAGAVGWDGGSQQSSWTCVWHSGVPGVRGLWEAGDRTGVEGDAKQHQ